MHRRQLPLGGSVGGQSGNARMDGKGWAGLTAHSSAASGRMFLATASLFASDVCKSANTAR